MLIMFWEQVISGGGGSAGRIRLVTVVLLGLGLIAVALNFHVIAESANLNRYSDNVTVRVGGLPQENCSFNGTYTLVFRGTVYISGAGSFRQRLIGLDNGCDVRIALNCWPSENIPKKWSGICSHEAQHFAGVSDGVSYISSMQASRFALCPGGRQPSSYRFREVLKIGSSVPVIFDDRIILPFSEIINWGGAVIRWPEAMPSFEAAVINLRRMAESERLQMLSHGTRAFEKYFRTADNMVQGIADVFLYRRSLAFGMDRAFNWTSLGMDRSFNWTSLLQFGVSFYVYPGDGGRSEHKELLAAFRNSIYCTADPRNASLFIPSTDTLYIPRPRVASVQ